MKLILKILIFIYIIFSSSISFSDERIFGKWETNDGTVWDIIDGFKVSTGPILVTDSKGKLSTGVWNVKNDKSISIKLGYSSRDVILVNQTTLNWGSSLELIRKSDDSLSEKVFLKNDSKDFINKLVSNKWSNSDSKSAEFSTTFSNESGVVTTVDYDLVIKPIAWSIASDVMKISSSVIVEAFITENYLVGLTSRDKFIVYKKIGEAQKKDKTFMKEKQDLFFNSFLTGSWERDSWSGKYIYMFRPIYGELKGKKFTILKEKLVGHSNWEFSPSTGALKIGSTEYMQGTVVGNTLALLNKKGDQTFYTRNSESSSKRYNLTDVKKIPLNENSLDKIIKELSGQFQYANETYIFEFANEKRTGFVHRFRSSPFSITGETFKSNSIISESNVLYVLDDLVLFEDKNVFKRDSSVSRLKPKTDDEVKEDKINEEKRIETLGEKQVNAIITFSNGKSIEVPLGFDTLDGVAKIELVSQ